MQFRGPCQAAWPIPDRPGTVGFNVMSDCLSTPGDRLTRSREDKNVPMKNILECCTPLFSHGRVRTSYNILEMWRERLVGIRSRQHCPCDILPTQENGGNTTTSDPGLITSTLADQFDVSTTDQHTVTLRNLRSRLDHGATTRWDDRRGLDQCYDFLGYMLTPGPPDVADAVALSTVHQPTTVPYVDQADEANIIATLPSPAIPPTRY